MPYLCQICGKTFSTAGNRSRHKKVHAINIDSGNVNMQRHNLQDRRAKPVSSTNGSAALHHPFTCIVAGCTQSGKTVWVKSLLENAQKTIGPPPERIIWCYGQWQPMYVEMIDTLPGIEFYEGIPFEIDSQHFF